MDRLRVALLIAAVVVGGVGSHIATAQRATRAEQGCARAPAVMPAGLVIGMSRRSLPRGGGPTVETAELTANGSCAPSVAECLHVSTTALGLLYAQLRVRVRHRRGGGSWHYGDRRVYARWGVTRCELSDTRDAPTIDADRATFSAAFGAVLDAIATARSAPPR